MDLSGRNHARGMTKIDGVEDQHPLKKSLVGGSRDSEIDRTTMRFRKLLSQTAIQVA